jgi:hypothetical protein
MKELKSWLSLIRTIFPLVALVGMVYFLELTSHPYFVLSVVLVFLGIIALGLFQARGLRPINRAIKRLIAGETDAVIAESGAKWAQGDHSLEKAIILSIAYSYQGDGVEGEKFACEALAALEKRGLSRKTDKVSRIFVELGAITFYDARVTQGRYIEAAHYLNQHLANAVRPNYLAVAVANAFFLGNDVDNARAALTMVQPPGGPRNQEKWIPPKYLFMLAYLRHKLLGADMRPELNQLREQYLEWQKEAARNEANPYGARLREVLDEIGELLTPV